MNARLPIRLLDRRAEDEQHQHVAEQVQEPAVDEHVGQEGPGAVEGVGRGELERVDQAGDVKTVRSSSSTTALATMSRPTQGVSGWRERRLMEHASNSETPITLTTVPSGGPAGRFDRSVAQVRKLDAHRPGGLGEQAGGRHPGQRIHL